MWKDEQCSFYYHYSHSYNGSAKISPCWSWEGPRLAPNDSTDKETKAREIQQRRSFWVESSFVLKRMGCLSFPEVPLGPGMAVLWEKGNLSPGKACTGEYFNELLPLGGQVVKCKMQTAQQRHANGSPFAQWSPLEELCLGCCFEGDGWSVSTSAQPALRLPLPPGGPRWLNSHESIWGSGADLPSSRCSRGTVPGMSSCCSTCGSVSMGKCTHGDTGFAFSISPQLQSSILMRPVDVKACFFVYPPKNIHYQKWINLY